MYQVPFTLPEKTAIGDDGVLDNFGQTATPLTVGQGGESERIDYHALGVVETTNQVLTAAVVDPDFPAKRGIDLGKYGCRDLPERKTSEESCRGEADDIADGTSPQRDHRRMTIISKPKPTFMERGHRTGTLDLLPDTQDNTIDRPAGFVEDHGQRTGKKPIDRSISDDLDLLGSSRGP